MHLLCPLAKWWIMSIHGKGSIASHSWMLDIPRSRRHFSFRDYCSYTLYVAGESLLVTATLSHHSNRRSFISNQHRAVTDISTVTALFIRGNKCERPDSISIAGGILSSKAIVLLDMIHTTDTAEHNILFQTDILITESSFKSFIKQKCKSILSPGSLKSEDLLMFSVVKNCKWNIWVLSYNGVRNWRNTSRGWWGIPNVVYSPKCSRSWTEENDTWEVDSCLSFCFHSPKSMYLRMNPNIFSEKNSNDDKRVNR